MPSVLFHVVQSTYNPQTVTAVIECSSLVVQSPIANEDPEIPTLGLS